MADAPKPESRPDVKPAQATAAATAGGEDAIVKALQRAFPHASPEFAPPPSSEIREGGEFIVRGRRVDAHGHEIKGDKATDHVVPSTPPTA